MTPPADILIVNGRVFGADDASQTTVAVAGSRIAAVGTDALAAHWRGPRTDVIDARGGLVMPGFNDAHMHLRHGALGLDQLDLFGMTDLSDIQAAIRRYAAERADDEWVVGRGWLYTAFPGGMPTREQLDAAVPDRPAYFGCFDGHSGWANTRGLALAGIDESTPDPLNGEIVRDARGRPTGALKEAATELVNASLPEPDEEHLLRLAARALDELAQAGITACQDAWATPADMELFARLRTRQDFPVRLRVALELTPEAARTDLAGVLDEFAAAGELAADPFFRSGIVKSFVDGVVEARTAYMLEPYPGTDSRGDPRWTDAELTSVVAGLHRRGWQVELHAIGMAAVRQALDAYEALGVGAAAERRHRVEHIETIHPADLPRFAELGVVASIQPLHAIPDAEQADTWGSMLDPAIAATGWRTRSLLESGAVVCFGTDWPVVPYEPFASLHAAVSRRSLAGTPEGGFIPAEAVSIEAALTAYTWGSAYAEHTEGARGRLAEGMAADLIVLDRDLIPEGKSAIIGTKVRLTVSGGRVVHRLD
jgi:predicted amidohydrolase YtcJ